MSIFLWSVLLACGRFFGLGGIEESRDSSRDAWFSLFSVLPFASRRFVAAGLLLPALVRFYVAGTSRIILLHGIDVAGMALSTNRRC